MSILTIGEVQAMKKGDELDDAVAHIVMEWPEYIARMTPDYTGFHPSRSILSALEVVKKMEHLNYCLNLSSRKSFGTVKWSASFNNCGGQRDSYLMAMESDIEVAICKAALLIKVKK